MATRPSGTDTDTDTESDTDSNSNRLRPARVVAAVLIGAVLVACGRPEPKSTDPFSTAEKHPEPATKSSSAPASGVVEPPLAAVIPEDAQAKPATGAESSQSKAAGPGNGSTAIGGKTQ